MFEARATLGGALGRDEMTKFGDFAVHAQRCEELAEICTDRTIALKLRALAKEYRDMAEHSTAAPAASKPGTPAD
jgi:hypothetical protein